MLIPLGFLAGSGGGVDSGFELIRTEIISGSSTSSVVFNVSSLASTYRHLQIRFAARSTRSGEVVSNLNLRLNGATSGYFSHILDTSGGTTVRGVAGSLSYLYLSEWLPGATGTSNAFLAGTIDLLDAFSTTKNKTIRTLNGVPASVNAIALNSGGWFNTSAITSIEFYDGFAPLLAGTRVSLYGIKG